MNVASPDISALDFSVLFDISTATPSVKITNLSTVVNAANLKWIFELITPNKTVVHSGQFSAPDIDGAAFTTFTFSEQIPQIFNQVEFSRTSKYSVKVSVQDSELNVFELTKSASFCKPNGNNGKNNFGLAEIEIKAKCEKQKLFVSDKTNVVYNSILGTKVSTVLKLEYPQDNNGNTIPTVTVNTTPALIPILYEGEGYNIYAAHVYDYDLGDGFIVRIRYSFKKTFPVWCNVDLCPLLCDIERLSKEIDSNCDVQSKKEQSVKLASINAKMLKAVIGVMQPLCNIDVPAVVEEIKEIGGFTCDCCRPSGIIQNPTVTPSGLNFGVNKICGDAVLDWDVDEVGNVTLNYKDLSYNFVMCDDKPDAENSAAFEIGSSVDTCTKTFCIFVNKALLAEEIVNEIKVNQNLINIFNSLIVSSGMNCSGLDGMGVIDTTMCEYFAEISTGVVAVRVLALATATTDYGAPANLDVTNVSTFQTWLNGLGIGTFTVTYDSFNNKVTVLGVNTTTALLNFELINSPYTGGTEYTVDFTNNCGSICRILQAIISYLKNLNLLQVLAGQKIKVCKIQNSQVVSTIYEPTDTAFTVISAISDALCTLSDLIVKGLDPKILLGGFKTPTTVVGFNGGDIVLMTVNGEATKVPVKDFAISLFQLLCSDAEVKAAYCGCATCTTVSNCNNVTGLAVSAGDTSASASWNNVVGAIGYKYSIDGVNYILTGALSAVVTGLTAATNYTFRVYPVYNNGDGSACEVDLSFVTTNVGVACAAPASLTVGTIGTTSATLTWAAVPSASGYQYRLNGGTWVNIGNTTSVSLYGLADNTLYNFEVRAIVGGNPCAEISDDSFTTLEEGFFLVENNVTGAPVSQITTITAGIYTLGTGALPLEPSDTLTGTVNVYSGIISVGISEVSESLLLKLFRNGELVETINVESDGTYDFVTEEFTSSDNVVITLEVAP